MKCARSNVVLMAFAISYSLFTVNYSLATEPPAAVTPYTFLGRVMDSTHVAFDGDRAATIEVSDASGKFLARTATFFRADSRRNYSLEVPMSTSSANGYVVQDTALEIEVTDDLGKVWNGVMVDAAAGVPGGVREVDIVLGEDLNGDGIDDQLYKRLKSEWERSEYWRSGETFDPTKDYDGDGISTINEALAGTNPYDPEDALRITAISRTGGTRSRASGADLLSTSGGSQLAATALTFDAIGGHAYTVEEASDLVKKDWKPCAFMLPDSSTPVNVLSVPADAGIAPSTVYLLPSSVSNAFFRVRTK
ncbi:MAG: hypothetical protein IJ658_04960 [Kiritimatiellae bacterium]|nr:hypothetical protein [Kiritimatiellia bacterium]